MLTSLRAALFGAALLLPLAVLAQTRTLTMKEAVLGGANRELLPATLANLAFAESGGNLLYREKTGTEDLLYIADPLEPSKRQSFSLQRLNGFLAQGKHPELKRWPAMRVDARGKMVFQQGSSYFEVDEKGQKVNLLYTLPDDADNPDEDAPTHHLAYTLRNALWIARPGQPALQVATDADSNIIYGSSKVHRNEFGITKGTFWSPDGNQLAFYRLDQRMVTDYPIVSVQTRPASATLIKYPMAGNASHQATVGVFNIATGKTTYLQTTGDPEHYLTNIAWNPQGTEVYIAELNRDQNHMWLRAYSAATGQLERTLFEETSPQYTEPQHAPLFVKGNPKQLVWQSERDGYNHLYLYDTQGQLLRQLTLGNWVVTDVLGFDNKNNIIYQSTAQSPLQRHIFRLPVSGKGQAVLLTPGAGTHTGELSANGIFLTDSWSSITVPRTVRVVGVQSGKVLRTLLASANPTAGIAMGQMRMFTMKAADGQTDLWCRMILPPAFDSTRKYPTVTYLYNGPHVQLITNSWLGGANLWMHLMAQKGYIVFTVDGRGSGNRGAAFERATFRNLGTEEMRDQLQARNWLANRPYVDSTRMGIHGWSFGGFMTTTLMTRTPWAYKVGVGGGPVIDWKYYEIMYTERYMDRPQDNPNGYSTAELTQYVGRLRGKLLLIHGTVDDVVVWQNSLNYVKAAVDKGVQLDYFVYPGHPHNVLGPDRVHLMQKVTDYFDTFLK